MQLFSWGLGLAPSKVFPSKDQLEEVVLSEANYSCFYFFFQGTGGKEPKIVSDRGKPKEEVREKTDVKQDERKGETEGKKKMKKKNKTEEKKEVEKVTFRSLLNLQVFIGLKENKNCKLLKRFILTTWMCI